MYAKLLRFDVGFGRPRAAAQIAQESEKTMTRWPGFQSATLLADYLGGRYTLISYWTSHHDYYEFSYSPDARELDKTITDLLSGVPYVGFYQVYQPA